MKKTNLFIAAFTVFAVASFTSCKKDEEDQENTTTTVTIPETATQKLCDKSFKMTAWTSSPAWQGVTDVYAVTLPCYLDNTMVFHTIGTVIGGEGANKCNAGDPQTTSGTWVFINNETVLVVNDTTIYNVLVNDGTTLKLSATYIDKTVPSSPDTLLFTTTFTKQ